MTRTFNLFLLIFLLCAPPAFSGDTEEKVNSLLDTASDLSIPKDRRQSAADEIVTLGAKATPHLIANLDTVNIWKLRASMDILKRIGTPAVPHLINAMDGKNREIAYRSVLVLGDIPDKRAVGPLVKGLGSKDWRIRSACAKSLGSMKSFEAIGPLIQATHDPEEAVRRAAAVSLGKSGDPLAIDPLVRLLGDPQFMVRHPAAEALAAIGKPAVSKLKGALESDDPIVLIAALEAIGGIKSEESVKAAAKMLKHEDWAVRGAAVWALRRINSLSSNNALRKVASNEKHPFVLSRLVRPLPEKKEPE